MPHENAAINPRGTTPDHLQKMRILRELVQANAEIEFVTSDLHVEVAEARTKLAEAREFFDYVPGEKYLVEEGVVTFAEKTETGDTRMYYLYPEEFPEVYELKKRRKEIAGESLQRVMVILRGEPRR